VKCKLLVRVGVLFLALGCVVPAGAQTQPPTPPPSSMRSAPIFVAPKGWTKVSNPTPSAEMTQLGSYVHLVAASAQAFQVSEAATGGLDLSHYVQRNMIEIRTMPGVTVYANGPATMCNNRPAWLYKYRTTDAGHVMMIAQMIAVAGAHAYIATYARLATQKDDANAMAALRSLCPPPEPNAGVAAEVPFTAPRTFKRINPSMVTSHDGVLTLWRGDASGSFPETITLVRSRNAGSSKPIAMRAEVTLDALKKTFPTMVLRQSHQEEVCGRYDGWYLETAMDVNGHSAIMEQVVVLSDSTEYVVTYKRPADRPESAPARQALDTLCPTDASVAS
jgi:hypothetical protein